MMKRVICSLVSLMIGLGLIGHASAMPSEAQVRELGNSVLRVKVNLPNGKHGLGSAVVISQGEVITSCHVVNDATDITIIYNGMPHEVSAIKPDWRHDLCVLKVEGLDAPAVKIGSSEGLKYDESVFTVGYPDETTQPVSTHGVVKEKFPLDGSMVIRATSSFRLGASGGGAFDDAGNLVGIITVKSKGSRAYYYYMPVELVQALTKKPAEALGVMGEKPFWASVDNHRPYFMRVVYPFQNGDWNTLMALAEEWSRREPNTAESWFYLATAEFAKKDYVNAEVHFQKVLTLKEGHREAIEYLKKISDKQTNIKLASY